MAVCIPCFSIFREDWTRVLHLSVWTLDFEYLLVLVNFLPSPVSVHLAFTHTGFVLFCINMMHNAYRI